MPCLIHDVTLRLHKIHAQDPLPEYPQLRLIKIHTRNFSITSKSGANSKMQLILLPGFVTHTSLTCFNVILKPCSGKCRNDFFSETFRKDIPAKVSGTIYFRLK